MAHDTDSEYLRPRTARHTAAAASVRRFSYVLLATVLSTVIVIADRIVDAWTSGGLLLALVVLWFAVFGGLVLFTRISVRLALWITAAWRELSPRRQACEPDAHQG